MSLISKLALVIALASGDAQPPLIPTFSATDIHAWRQSIRPTQRELAYQSIPWLATFEAGVRASATEGKPLLLWLMNGHPLGCT